MTDTLPIGDEDVDDVDEKDSDTDEDSQQSSQIDDSRHDGDEGCDTTDAEDDMSIEGSVGDEEVFLFRLSFTKLFESFHSRFW